MMHRVRLAAKEAASRHHMVLSFRILHGTDTKRFLPGLCRDTEVWLVVKAAEQLREVEVNRPTGCICTGRRRKSCRRCCWLLCKPLSKQPT